MRQELDAMQVLAAAEAIYKKSEFAERRIAIRVDDNHFISIAIFLVSINEVRRKLSRKENHSILACDALIDGLVGRFERTIDDDLPKFVNIEMSRRELDAVGYALVEGRDGNGKNPKLENKMRGHVYGAYLYFDGVFVGAGGSENTSLRNDVKNLSRRVGKRR